MTPTPDLLIALVSVGGMVFILSAVVSCVRDRAHAKDELIEAMSGLLAARERSPRPAPVLVGFTPAERESFGINDTDRWIAETDRVLSEATS